MMKIPKTMTKRLYIFLSLTIIFLSKISFADSSSPQDILDAAKQISPTIQDANNQIATFAAIETLKTNSASTRLLPPQPTDGEFKTTTSEVLTESSSQQIKLAAFNADSINKATEEALKNSKLVIPNITTLGYNMRDGKALTSSPDGDKVIPLIRSLINNPQQTKPDTLQKIKAYSDANVPEAQNFIGFIYEHGLFGYKKDLDLSFQYYRLAATQKYEPAFYNLALMYAYGKKIQVNLNAASSLLSNAYRMPQDTSYRVCAMTSFVNYKLNLNAEAIKTSSSCISPLANLVNATYNTTLPFDQRISLLRTSLTTGIDDAYLIIQKIAINNNSLQGYQTYCKYKLIQFYSTNKDFSQLTKLAEECAIQTKQLDPANKNKPEYKTFLDGITGTVPMELNEINTLKNSNHFHYSWGVPYLPFTITDATNLEALKKL